MTEALIPSAAMNAQGADSARLCPAWLLERWTEKHGKGLIVGF
jgi:hypothetical protein